MRIFSYSNRGRNSRTFYVNGVLTEGSFDEQKKTMTLYLPDEEIKEGMEIKIWD